MNTITGLVIITALIVGYLTYTAYLDHQLRMARLELRGADWTEDIEPLPAPDPGFSFPVRDANLTTERINLALDGAGVVQFDTTTRSMDEIPNADHVHDLQDECLRNRMGAPCISGGRA